MKKKSLFKYLPLALEEGFTADEFWKLFSTLQHGFTLEIMSGENEIFIRYSGKIIATQHRNLANSDWVQREIKEYISKNGLMDGTAKKVIRFIRGILWIIPFYLISLLTRIVYLNLFQCVVLDTGENHVGIPHSYPDINLTTGQNLLGIGILFSSIFIMAILYQTREEDRFKKQIKNLISLASGTLVIYALCCLLYYLIWGRWVLPYLWF